MTVADNTSRNQYTATPSQALFAYTFEIVDKDDIVVLINGIPLSEGTDYTVTGVGSDTGGNIVLTSGTTGGNIVTIYRDMPYARTQNYTNSGDFLASEVNSDFDSLWLAGEQTNRAFSQSIRKPITDSDSISMELPEAASRANKFVKFDANGAVDLAAGVTTDVAADDVSITDSGGYYTSDNVEGALQEIGAQPPGFDPNTDSFNIGSDAVSSGTDSIALGHDASATAARDIALGFDAVASGGGSIAIGQETDSTGTRSIAIGKGAQSTFSTSIALGEDASTLGGAGGGPIAIGYSATSTGISGISLGSDATASGSQSVSIGNTASASSDSSIALGYDAEATGTSSIALGDSSRSSAVDTIAIGNSSSADAQGAVSIGTGSDASRIGSIALGRNAQGTGSGSTIAIGDGATTFNGLASPIAIGYQANTTGAYGVGIGYQTVTSGAQGIAIGYIASATNDNGIAIGRQLTVAGQKAIGIGWSAVAASYDSIGIGAFANASTADCISIGKNSESLSSGGIAIGSGASIDTTNLYGVAVGYNASATEIGGIAIGHNALCENQFGTALGRDSTAVAGGGYAVALGYGAYALANSTAINKSRATGQQAIAISYDALASGLGSIAMGYNSDALGDNAIAIGKVAGADAANTIHINASGVDTNQPQTAGYIVIETDDAALKYDGSWSLTGGALELPDGIDVTGTITTDGMTTSADINFGDNNKAVFGAGNDLEIYSDGTTSIIQESGPGALNIQGTHLNLRNSAGSATYLGAVDGGAVTLYNSGSAKLATTSTGIDVTGTVTADGVNTDYTNGFKIFDGTSLEASWTHVNTTGTSTLNVGRNATWGGELILQTDTKNRANFASNGDISFYEDTGTTAKFFWDAADERLGLGTTSPSGILDINTSGAGVNIQAGNAAADIALGIGSPSTANKVVVTAGGKVGIGTSSPDTLLELVGDDPVLTIRDSATGSATANATLRLAETGASDTLDAYWDIKAVGGDLQFIDNWNEGGGTGTRLVIDDSGNVGIGTSNPTAPTDIRGANTATQGRGQLYLSNTETAAINQGSQIALGGTYSGTSDTFFASIAGRKENGTSGDYAGYLQFATRVSGGGNTEAMRIDSSGNVGINTSNPLGHLHVEESGAAARFIVKRADGTNPADSATIDLLEGSVGGGFGAANNYGFRIALDGADNKLNIISGNQTTTNTRVTLERDSGNVGIGTSNPATELEVNGDIGIGRSAGGYTFRETVGGGERASLKSNASNELLFSIGAASEAMRIDSSGIVQISNATPTLKFTDTDNNYDATIQGLSGSLVLKADSGAEFGTESIQFRTGGDEAMRIDSDGNLLVGRTSTSGVDTDGHVSFASGESYQSATSNTVQFINRNGTDGSLLSFYKAGSPVGSIGANVSRFYIHGSYGSGSGLRFDNASIRPATSTGTSSDDTTDLGAASARFDDIYATNSTIQTSDRNEKQDIEELSDAEQRVAVACKGLLRKFRWKSAVEEKGDDARIHFGIIAQDLQDAFTAEGLDAGRYAMFISTTWTDEETGEERTRMGVRYSELLAFIIAAI